MMLYNLNTPRATTAETTEDNISSDDQESADQDSDSNVWF